MVLSPPSARQKSRIPPPPAFPGVVEKKGPRPPQPVLVQDGVAVDKRQESPRGVLISDEASRGRCELPRPLQSQDPNRKLAGDLDRVVLRRGVDVDHFIVVHSIERSKHRLQALSNAGGFIATDDNDG